MFYEKTPVIAVWINLSTCFAEANSVASLQTFVADCTGSFLVILNY